MKKYTDEKSFLETKREIEKTADIKDTERTRHEQRAESTETMRNEERRKNEKRRRNEKCRRNEERRKNEKRRKSERSAADGKKAVFGSGEGADLENGSIGALMLRLALPTVVAQLVNMLYNIVDRVYIGHMPGSGADALTGVGLCFPLITLVTAFSSLMCAGGAPRAAISMGQKDDRRAEQIMGNCFIALIFTAILLTAFIEVFTEPILSLFGASENTLPYAVSYMRYYAAGTVFIMISLGMNMFIMSQGYAGVSMMTTLIGAFFNIILDPIFIFVLDMGVKGAAVATVISQAVSAVWVVSFLLGRRAKLRLRAGSMRLQAKIILPSLALGLSPFVMQSTESLLNICFNFSLARFGGDSAVGAMTIIASTAQLMAMPTIGICQGGQPIISFNFGAGNDLRVKQAFRRQFTACLTYAAVFFTCAMLFPRILAGIFTGDEVLLSYTVRYFRLYHAGVLMIGIQICCQQAFMALGQAKISLLLACLRKMILLIPLIFILPIFFQNDLFAVFLAEPVSDIIASLVTGTLFFTRLPHILKKGARRFDG